MECKLRLCRLKAAKYRQRQRASILTRGIGALLYLTKKFLLQAISPKADTCDIGTRTQARIHLNICSSPGCRSPPVLHFHRIFQL